MPGSSPHLALCLLLGLTGCGYKLVDESRVFGPDVRRIQLQMFENRSAEPGLERALADALQEEFLRRGALAPSDDPADSQLELTGVIRRVGVRPIAFSSVALSLEEEVTVVVDVVVVQAVDGDEVWVAQELEERERFSASADPGVYATNKEQALRRLAAGLASLIHDELFQPF